MGNILLLAGVLLSLFVTIESGVSRDARQATQQQATQDARVLAAQMLTLSRAYGHWHYRHPDSTTLPDLSSLSLPYSTPDSRIHYAVSGNRFWVWVDEGAAPGIASWLKTRSLDSRLLYRLSGGLLQDMSGTLSGTDPLVLPPSLASATNSQIIHLN